MLYEKMETFSAAELQLKHFPPIAYVVEPYIVEGLTIIAGKPKLGKSWMVLDIALSVACGAHAFGSIQCEQGDVLYCALEDNPRRLQSRTGQLMGDVADWPAGLSFTHSLPRIGEGALEELDMWRQSVPKPRLVIIDTFAKIRPNRRNADATYDSDYAALIPLQEWASKSSVACIIVHHLRKAESDDPLDSVSGSTGFTGCADTTLVLNRDGNGVTLYGRGRDIDEFETAVKHDPSTGLWSILGNADEVHSSHERQTIITALRDANEPLSPSNVSDVTGMPANNVRFLLHKMYKDGQIEKASRGKYIITGYPTNNANIANNVEFLRPVGPLAANIAANIKGKPQ